MGRIEELRCFSRFVKVKVANMSSLFVFVSSNVFFFTERILYSKSKTYLFMHILKVFTAKKL